MNYMRISIGNWSGNFEIIVIICILFVIIALHTCSCRQENYSNIHSINTYADAYAQPPIITNWNQPSLIITPEQPLPQGVIDIISRPKQPVPLPNGQMDMFATTSFSPKCCPNTFSNSMGCACMTLEQQKYLTQRGGNNNPPEF